MKASDLEGVLAEIVAIDGDFEVPQSLINRLVKRCEECEGWMGGFTRVSKRLHEECSKRRRMQRWRRHKHEDQRQG